MSIPPPPELIRFIREGKRFIVAGHEEPDGDCIGSQLALTSLLRRLGKEALTCTAGPFKRSEVKPLAPRFEPCPADAPRNGTRLIVVDCSTRERVGDLPVDNLETAVIDHHASGSPWGKAVYLDPDAPSVTFMILQLFEALGIQPDAEEAQLLLFGLCTDTGFFRHLDAASGEIFTAASRLIAAGANPKQTFAWINGGKTLPSRILLGLLLSRAESYYGGRLICTYETYEDTQKYGEQSRDSDMLYQLLQSVDGVEAIFAIRQEQSDRCTVGFRSRDAVDVSKVALHFGGGGHKNASGAAITGIIADLKPQIIERFGEVLGADD